MKTWKLWAVMLSAVLSAVISFWCLFLFDNKYLWPGPAGEKGVTDLTSWDEEDFVFLIHGWEVYENRLLTPDEIRLQGLEPDRYVYAGQYGGFEYGDRSRRPDGSATYRMRLLLGQEEHQYCLALPEIYSAYRLWINGRLVKCVGDPNPESYFARTQIASQEFWASGEAEIIFQVSNFSSFYSGMVYPPAFGTPDAVREMQNLHLILHTVTAFGSLFLGLLCLISGIWGKEVRHHTRLFFLLCFFYAVYVGYPMVHTLGLQGMGWYLLEKEGLYVMILALVLLSAGLCQVPLGIRSVMFAAGATVCMLILLFPFLPVRWSVDVMRLYSRLLHWWQWAAAGYLFLASAAVMRKGERETAVLGWGMVYFGISLIANSISGSFEPVYTGWMPELGGCLMIVMIGGALVFRSRQSYRKRLQIERLKEAAYLELEVQKRYSNMLIGYLEQTSKRNHDFKKNLELMIYYMGQQDYRSLGEYLAGLYKKEEGIELPVFTINPLINSIMATRYGTAVRSGIEVSFQLLKVPKELPMDDGELCSLLANLLDNAIEGAQRLPEDSKKWVKINMEMKDYCFSVLVENSAVEAPEQKKGFRRTQKKDFIHHGYGTEIISEIVEAHHGIEKVHWENGVYRHHAILFLEPKGD